MVKLEEDSPLVVLDDESQFDKDEECQKNKQQLRTLVSKPRTLPDPTETMPEGFEDHEQQEEKKPDRPSQKHELEFSMTDLPVASYPLYRAREKKGRKELYEVGKAKIKIRISKKNQPLPAIDLKQLYSAQQYVVRLYCLEAFQLVPQDFNGKNNPYLIVTNGIKTINDSKNFIENSNRPQFFKCYELECDFPQQAQVTLKVMDQDSMGSDDLIGQTTIDLENRLFSDEWQRMKLKPTEWRTLWNPSSSSPQGQLKLWAEILTPLEAKKNPIIDISPPRPIDFELRVIIWETAEVEIRDTEGSDIFVTGQMVGTDDSQATDTHWNSTNGEGLFNWRMVFPLRYPSDQTPRFRVQIWDKDVINPDDALGEAIINLRGVIKRGWKSKGDRQLVDQNWVSLTHPRTKGSTGRVLLSFDLLSAAEASRKPAGLGRKEPNNNPFLPEPHRPETSFSPVRVDKFIEHQFFGRYKYQLILGGVGVICCLLCVLLIIVAYVYRSFFG